MNYSVLSLSFLIPILFSLFILFYFVNFVDATSNSIIEPVISFCTAFLHSCAVFGNKRMKCWGEDIYLGLDNDYEFGTLPFGDNIPYFNPGTSVNITQVSCSSFGLCILLDTGNIKCVGDNKSGQCGIGATASIVGAYSNLVGDTLPAVILGNGIKASKIVSGWSHNCALSTMSKVKCFGKNDYGQLGLGDSRNRGASLSHMGESLPFIDFGLGVEIASIHSGIDADHNCVILSKPIAKTQRIKCWGRNNLYQLGYGSKKHQGDNGEEMGDNLPLVNLGIESRVKNIIISNTVTCTLLINDALKCWGTSIYGQLGSGSKDPISLTGNSLPSVLIDSGKSVKLIAAGSSHSCIVYDDMLSIKCFGNNEYGQLGQGDTIQRGDSLTTTIPNIPNVDLGTGSLKIQSVVCGSGTTCVILLNGAIKCFGYNNRGLLATGAVENIGNEPNEMGMNLKYSILFGTTSPSQSPTNTPTKKPSRMQTTKKPTKFPFA